MRVDVILEKQTVPPSLPHATRDVELQQVVDYIRARVGWPANLRPTIISPTQPSADYTDCLWMRHDATTGVPTGLFFYNPVSGAWETVLLTTMSTITVYGAGTAYQLTATSAKVDLGTTDPAIVVNQAGTYLIMALARVDYNGATFLAERTVTLKLRRTNNTAADLTNSSCQLKTALVTTLNHTLGWIALPQVIYTTANADDAVELWGDVGVLPTAGSLDVVDASIVAVRLF